MTCLTHLTCQLAGFECKYAGRVFSKQICKQKLECLNEASSGKYLCIYYSQFAGGVVPPPPVNLESKALI